MAAFALAVSLSWSSAARAQPKTWRFDATDSELFVDVHKAGAASPFLHDHHYRVTSLSGTATLDARAPDHPRVALTARSDSLRDEHPGLSDKDRRRVDAEAASPEVLDAARYPEVTFRAERFVPAKSGGLEGEVDGTLRIRDRQRAVKVPVHARQDGDTLEVKGAFQIRQSDFGIRPLNRGFGTIRVHDELELTFTLRGHAE